MTESLAERLKTQFPPGFTVYRVQDTWGERRGVVIRRPTRWWRRTWQAEWDGCQRAVRAYTRNGCIVKAVRHIDGSACVDYGHHGRERCVVCGIPNPEHNDRDDLCNECHHQRRSHWPVCNYAECDCEQFVGCED